MREQAKIQNYLQGKAMLEAQLAQSDLSDAEKAEIRDRLKAEGVASAMGLTTEKAIAQHEREAQAQQAKRESELAWLLDADKSESQRHAEHINSDEYKAYQAKLLAWHQEQERKKAEEAERQQRSATWAAFREMEKESYVSAIWAAFPGVSPSTSSDFIFNNYHVDQYVNGTWPSKNECVTAATIQTMNIMQDILDEKFGIGQIPHDDLPSFAAKFDAGGLRNYFLRPPADSGTFGGMMLPQNAVKVLNRHGNELRATYGCGYTAELTSGNIPDDIIQNLQNGYPTNLHIAFDAKGSDLSWLGGHPHTVTVVGHDPASDAWYILDPAISTDYRKWNTNELIDHWGRQFTFYPSRFSMTTLIPDSFCTVQPVQTPAPIPTSTSPPTPIPPPTPDSTIPPDAGTPVPSQNP
jgi:hypothetical protein